MGWGGGRGRDRKPNSVGGEGERQTESLILWLVVLKFLAGGWWWREAQSLIQGLLETPISHTRLCKHQPWGWVRLSDWVKETQCVVKAEWKIFFIWFYDFYFLFAFYYILCVKFLQNHQVIVTSLGLCCWPGRRVPQSPDCWSSCNIGGKMREGGRGGWWQGNGHCHWGCAESGWERQILSPMRDGIVLKYEK